MKLESAISTFCLVQELHFSVKQTTNAYSESTYQHEIFNPKSKIQNW
jgi:hypothetical protein